MHTQIRDKIIVQLAYNKNDAEKLKNLIAIRIIEFNGQKVSSTISKETIIDELDAISLTESRLYQNTLLLPFEK